MLWNKIRTLLRIWRRKIFGVDTLVLDPRSLKLDMGQQQQEDALVFLYRQEPEQLTNIQLFRFLRWFGKDQRIVFKRIDVADPVSYKGRCVKDQPRLVLF